MKKQQLKVALAMAAGLVLSVVAPAFSQPQNSVMDRDPIAVYREAGASTEQQHKIRDVAKEYEADAGVKVARAKNLLKRMQDLSLEADPDEKSVLQTQEEINQLQADLAMSHIKLMLKIRSILSPEQRVKLVEIMKQRQQMGPGGGP